MEGMAEWGNHPTEMSDRQLIYWIAIGLISLVAPVIQLWEAQSISWLGVLLGAFVSTVVFSKATASTRPGQYIDTGWNRIGMPGRFVALFVFAVIVWWSIFHFEPPLVPLFSCVLGSFLGLIGEVGFVLAKRVVN